MNDILTPADYLAGSVLLGVEPAHIQAVASIEAGAYGAFLASGHPTVLFERHVFRRLTGGKWDESHPDVSGPYAPGTYGKTSAQPGRLGIARGLDDAAAVQSTSWGLFQIMGFNYRAAGYSTLLDFEFGMRLSASEQLIALVRFLKSTGLADPLREERWDDFARMYNGPDFRRSRYDERLRDAYEEARRS